MVKNLWLRLLSFRFVCDKKVTKHDIVNYAVFDQILASAELASLIEKWPLCALLPQS